MRTFHFKTFCVKAFFITFVSFNIFAQTPIEVLQNNPTIKTKLSNGIPLILQQNESYNDVAFCIVINGGECESPKNNKKIQTLLVDTIAHIIKEETKNYCKVKSQTDEIDSFITVTCKKENFANALQKVFDTILIEEIPPMVADYVASDIKLLNRLERINMGTQLKGEAFKILYKGTSYEFLKDTSISVLENTDYKAVVKTHAKLNNASRYTIIFCGNIAEEEVFTETEKTFGKLKNLGSTKQSIVTPFIQAKSLQKIDLQHFFTAKVVQEKTPEAPPILVPTEVFYDPAQVYISSPAGAKEQAIFNALLLDIFTKMKNFLGKNHPCKVELATATLKFGMIQADNLLERKIITDAYIICVQELKKELLEKEAESLLPLMKARLQKSEYSNEKTNEAVINIIKKNLCFEKETEVKDVFEYLSFASAKDFSNTLSKYFLKQPYLIYSSSLK